MGTKPAPEKCFITDQPTENITSSAFGTEYWVDYGGYTYKFAFHHNYYKNSDFINENKYILKGLIINGKWEESEQNIYTDGILKKLIIEAYYPKSPKEKLDNLLLYIFSQQNHEGQKLDIYKNIEVEILIHKLYFKSVDEYNFYLKTLIDMGYIDATDVTGMDGIGFLINSITYTGLQYIINIQEQGRLSNNCFIAMSFAKSMTETRESIRAVCEETGFNPIFIDEVHYDSDLTINDAIIANIKKCRFCIADFTEQKDGVYFEAGFALGRGIPVIYSCHHDWFKDSHFDTNHFPHIVYNTPEELKTHLKKKIEVWIL